MDYDIIIIGSGFCGATIAHKSAQLGKRVLLLEKRDVLAGNMYDELHDGVRVQRYGPHAFHTNNMEIYTYITQFSQWQSYSLSCRVFMEEKSTPSPFNFQTIDDYFSVEEAELIKSEIKKTYPEDDQQTILQLLDSPNAIIRNYAEFLFENDYEPYTCKQWGITPKELDKSVLARVPVLFNYSTAYFSDKYQIMPTYGYTDVITEMLASDLITIRISTDALEHLSVKDKGLFFHNTHIDIPVVYTGPIDTFFELMYGELPYRSLKFEYETHFTPSYQDAAVVAYPQDPDITRITEYTKLPEQQCENTVIAKEYPLQYVEGADQEPYYPIPCADSKEILDKYLSHAKQCVNLYLCGRLADYKYYNMDQAIERAMDVFEDIRRDCWSNEDY